MNLLTGDGERLDYRTLIVVLSGNHYLVGALIRTTVVGHGIVVRSHDGAVRNGHFRLLYLLVVDKGSLVECYHCVSQSLRQDGEGLHLFTGIVAYALHRNQSRSGIGVLAVCQGIVGSFAQRPVVHRHRHCRLVCCAVEGIFAGLQGHHKGVCTTAYNDERLCGLIGVVADTLHGHLIGSSLLTTLVGQRVVRILGQNHLTVLYGYARLLYRAVVVEYRRCQRHHTAG